MATKIRLGAIEAEVILKDIKNVHLSVHPPTGRVRIAAPARMKLDTIRVFAISKLGWIKQQQKKLAVQRRETQREYLDRESHYVWGRRYLLTVIHHDAKPRVTLSPRRLTLCVRPGSDQSKRAEVIHDWHKSLLHEAIPTLIHKWAPRLGVEVAGYSIQRMKTKWGTCNHRAGRIRLNTELVKKPRDLLEYVVVHELAHLLEPTHNDRFIAILEKHYPNWRETRAELNELPLAAESWKQ